tara:strand:+ start:202 stop:951 length:750 start_codon:yes stop_codon:yes gene_type:complete
MHKNTAKQGRFGDTKLREIDGELSHVNAFEAYVIDNNIANGEEFVKSNGLGSVNPETGLKEYFPWLIPAAIAAAYGAYNEYQDTGNLTLGGLWDYSLGNQGLAGSLFGDNDLSGMAKESVTKGYQGIKSKANQFFKPGGVFDAKTKSANQNFISNMSLEKNNLNLNQSKSNMAFSGNLINNHKMKMDKLFSDDKIMDQNLSAEKTQLGIDLQDKLSGLFLDYANITEEEFPNSSDMRTELNSLVGGNYG